ncbi:unnamed protein product, partial [marine sediment metagenome]
MTENPGGIRLLIRHSGPILIGKAIQYFGALLYAIVIPRLMGPSVYGVFAVYSSLLILLYVLGDFGSLAIYGHYVPAFLIEGEDERVQRLFTHLMLFKIGVGLIIGIVFVIIGKFILPEWPQEWLWLGATTIIIRIAADNFYHLAYGLDNMVRWIARESLRFVVQFILVLPLFFIFSIPGAITGILIADILFFLYGISWAWKYFRPLDIQFQYLMPFLRFGAA